MVRPFATLLATAPRVTTEARSEHPIHGRNGKSRAIRGQFEDLPPASESQTHRPRRSLQPYPNGAPRRFHAHLQADREDAVSGASKPGGGRIDRAELPDESERRRADLTHEGGIWGRFTKMKIGVAKLWK